MQERTCTVPDCKKPHVARGLCRAHYQRWWKRGTLELAPGYEPRTTRERLEAKFVRNESGCWTWTGTHDSNGYGKFSIDGGMANAHRVVYEMYVGPIPPGLELDHLCRNRGCVNPGHLEPVSPRVNVLRGEGMGAKYARRSECSRGHLFDEANTRMDRGARKCRTCERDRSRRRRAHQGGH